MARGGPARLGGGLRRRPAPRRRLRDDVGRPGRPPSTATPPFPGAVPVHPRRRTRRCTARSSGRCGCSPASARPRTPTRASRSSCARAATGLSTAFDMPTLMGRDSDDPLGARRGRQGRRRHRHARRHGGPVRRHRPRRGHHVDDDQRARRPSLMAMYVAVAEKQRRRRRAASAGTIQNDILKEYQAQKEYVFPPRPSMRLVTDLIRFTHRRDAPVAPGLDLRLPHPRGGLDGGAGAGLHRWPTGSPTSRRRMARGPRRRRVRAAAVASSSTPTSTSSRRSASSAPPGASGRGGCASATAPSDERSLQLRFHTQTAGVSLTAQQPEVNIARVAIQALAGGARAARRACTPTPTTRPWRCPTEKAARHRAAHPAGRRPRDRRRQRGRPARRLVPTSSG